MRNAFIRQHWQILTILIFYLCFNLYILNFSTPGADEATHSLLGLFYHDLLVDLIKHPTISFNKIYNYGITYLTYYPKLSIYYPPLFHFLVAFSYFIFGISIFSAKLVQVGFSLLALFSVYLLGKKLFDKKVALLSVIILMTSPIFVSVSREAFIDIALIFFFTITGFFYVQWLTNKKKDKQYFILGILSGALGLITKWQFLIMFPILFLYTLLEHRRKFTKLLLAFFLTTLIACPYLYVSYKIGAFSLQVFHTSQVVYRRETDLPWTEFGAWTFHAESLFLKQFLFPLSLFIVLSFLFYIWKGKKHKKFFLVWVLVFYLFFVYIPDKEVRFTMPYLQIFSIIFSIVFFGFIKHYKRYSKLLCSLLIILIIAQFCYSFINLRRLKEPIDDMISDIFEPGANIAIGVRSHNVYDSVFAFKLAKYDRDFRVRLFRPCELSIDALKQNGIKYIIITKPKGDANQLSEILPEYIQENIDSFETFREYEFDEENFLVLVYKEYRPSERRCNYICLTEEWVCSNFTVPVDALL